MHYSSKLLSLAKRVELQRVIKSHLLDKVKVLSRGLDKHLTHPLSPNHSSYQEYTLQGEGLTRLTPLNLSIGWTPASLENDHAFRSVLYRLFTSDYYSSFRLLLASTTLSRSEGNVVLVCIVSLKYLCLFECPFFFLFGIFDFIW